MRLLVATRNAGKLREIGAVLEPRGIRVAGLDQFAHPPPVVEDGETFLENARKKAWTLARAVGLPALADDSGLEVEALGGRPGVRSARYAGPGARDEDNNRKLLEDLKGVPAAARGARFVCAMVFAVPGEGEHFALGELRGRILEEGRGGGGFGYDPLFLPEGEGRTLAEMEVPAKNRISHRWQALSALLPALSAAAERVDG